MSAILHFLHFPEYDYDDLADVEAAAVATGSLDTSGERAHWMLVRACEVVSDALTLFMGRGLACYGLAKAGPEHVPVEEETGDQMAVEATTAAAAAAATQEDM